MKGYGRYFLNKLLWFLVTFFFAFLLNFILPRLMPGDPVAGIVSKLAQGMTNTTGIQKIYQQYANEFGTIGNSQLLKLPNGTYLMYYESWNCNSQNRNPGGQTCYAQDTLWAVNQASSPGIFNTWARSADNPLLGGSSFSAANPHVMLENGIYYAFVDYYLWNATLHTYNIIETLLTSTDGIHFTSIYGPTNPVLNIDVEKKFDPYCNQVGDAWVMVQPNGIYLFYDEDANVAANVTSTHASIWLAFLPNTTLPQLVSGQFGINASASEFPNPILADRHNYSCCSTNVPR